MPNVTLSELNGMQMPSTRGITLEQLNSMAPGNNAANENGVLDSMLIGAGRTFDKIGAGAQQVYYNLTGNQSKLDALASDQAEKDAHYKKLQEARPVATGFGQALPALPAAMAMGGGTLLPMMAKGAVASAVPEALSYGSLEDRTKNSAKAAAFGAAGGGLGYGLGKLITKLVNPVPALESSVSAATRLEQQGIPLNNAQVTGNPTLANINAALDNLPFTAGKQQAFRELQSQAINKAAGQHAGITGNVADDAARLAAKGNLSKGYSDVAARNEIPPENLFPAFGRMQQIVADSGNAPPVAAAYKKVVDRFASNVEANNGAMPGAIYKQLDSELGKLTQNYGVGQIRDELRSAMKASIRPEDAGAWGKLDSQYKALAQISKAVDEQGNISPLKLYTATRGKDVTKAGTTDLANLATDLKTIIPNPVPNSGTAQRGMWQGILTGGGGPESLRAGALGLLGLPMLTQKLANSPMLRAMSVNQGIPYVTPTAEALAPLLPRLGLLGSNALYQMQ